MRRALIFCLTAAALAQQVQVSHTTESLRGVSAVSRLVAWASGTHGTYLRTTDGLHWTPAQVPGAEALDFRGAVAFSADEAFLMSSGPGDQSRIYHTSDAGRHWALQFTNPNPKGFFDCMAFWDPAHGVILGDPVPDESGKPKFQLFTTNDGQSWGPLATSQLPPALEGEAAFAASNTCLAILNSRNSGSSTNGKGTTSSRAGGDQQGEGASAPERTGPDSNIWFATGGRATRVFHSADRGVTWQVFDTPILHGPDSTGIFSIAFRDPRHGVIAGGDSKHPKQDGPNLAFTTDGGKSWTLSSLRPLAYFSAAAYDYSYPKNRNPKQGTTAGGKQPQKNQNDVREGNERLFLVSPNFLFDFRPPHNPHRISPKKKSGVGFNAICPYPEGGALLVGPQGSIATIP
jgi:photosystem II stability/assembly factor-like uncharacterized protein